MATSQPTTVDEQPAPRWYPVIDYSRCVNCLECLDFCLFGVFGIDHEGRLFVESPDNCRTGCPACSRICPESAIMFPQHEAPAIAGDEAMANNAAMAIDQFFSVPEVVQISIAERDEHLMKAGRSSRPQIPRAKTKSQAETRSRARDDLDDLIDSVDQWDP